MSGAPITVFCYRNGIDTYGGWLTDPAVLDRVRILAAEGGRALVEDTIWYNREPWTRQITDHWPAVDSFRVALLLDQDNDAPPSVAAKPARSAGGKAKKSAKKKR